MMLIGSKPRWWSLSEEGSSTGNREMKRKGMDDPLYVNPGVVSLRFLSRGPDKAESLARFAGQRLSKDPEDVVLILVADACRPSAEGE